MELMWLWPELRGWHQGGVVRSPSPQPNTRPCVPKHEVTHRTKCALD